MFTSDPYNQEDSVRATISYIKDTLVCSLKDSAMIDSDMET